MEHLFPLFFVLYIIGSVVSAVMKKRQGDMERRRAPSFPPVSPVPPAAPVPPAESARPAQLGKLSLDETIEAPTAHRERVLEVAPTPVRQERVRRVIDAPPSTRRPRITSTRITSTDVRRSIVMAELLDLPRALRPYRPPKYMRN